MISLLFLLSGILIAQLLKYLSAGILRDKTMDDKLIMINKITLSIPKTISRKNLNISFELSTNQNLIKVPIFEPTYII